MDPRSESLRIRSTSDSSTLIDNDFDSNFEPPPTSKITHLVQLARKSAFRFTVEPVMFLVMFGSTLSGNLVTNLLLIRTCEFMKLDNCTNIDTQSGGDAEKIVQPYVADLGMYRSFIENLVPAILAFFVGPWCDAYGRRPLLLSTLLGYCLNLILLVGFTWFMLPPMFILLTSIPLGLMGGSMGLFTASFTYINDVAPSKDLSFRMAVAESMLFLGLLCGNAVVPYLYGIFPSHGFEWVFTVSFGFCLCALLYATFLLPESVTTINENTVGGRLRALFDYQQVLGLFRVCFGNYDGYSRSIRLVIVTVSVLSLLALEGTISVTFLFTRREFLWDLKEFTTYADVALLMSLCGIFFGTTIFSKLLHLPNVPLTCFALFLKAVSYLIIAVGSSGWYMYLSSAIGALGGMSGPVNRAILSDTIPKEDSGKLFALLSALNATLPLVAAVTYTQLYNSTVDTHPGAVFLLSTAFLVLSMMILGLTVMIPRIFDQTPHSTSYGPIDNNLDRPTTSQVS